MRRVEIPAYTDAWMRGDRCGEIVRTSNARPAVRAALLTQDPRRYTGEIEIATVRLDKSGKTVRVVLDDCRIIE